MNTSVVGGPGCVSASPPVGERHAEPACRLRKMRDLLFAPRGAGVAIAWSCYGQLVGDRCAQLALELVETFVERACADRGGEVGVAGESHPRQSLSVARGVLFSEAEFSFDDREHVC